MNKKMTWKKKKVLVTGATGLVGSWLTQRLIELGAHVVVLIRDHSRQSYLFSHHVYKQVELTQGNLEDYASVERAINENEVEVVFHLGAQTIVKTAWKNPLATFEANIRGSYHLLEACRRHADTVKKIVIASSDKAYGSSPVLPYDESTVLNGKHPYDVSKTCTDLLAASYFHTYRLPIAIARCGNIYGGADFNWSRIIPGTILRLLNGEPPLLRSNGTLTRDYLYVDDAVEGYIMLAEALDHPKVQGEAFNFGQTKPYSALEIVSVLQRLMNCDHLSPQTSPETVCEIEHQWLNVEKANTILGWRCRYSLEEGLAATLKWYKKHFESRQPY